MKWTRKQQQVIEARGCNLLVSAAAGSGKTAVLVERILRLICDEKEPVDIDRLLVVTFTNAAAAEMRERISQAIERKLEEEPGREHLQVQAALVHRAQITTIHSFCLGLIRDHVNLLKLDPAFRIGDEGELKLLRADVMEGLLEDYYQKGDEGFFRFVETYATGKSDQGIEEDILRAYTFSQSHPFPEEWLWGCRKEFEDPQEETGWLRFLMKDAKSQLLELAGQLEGAANLCREEGGPAAYLPTLLEESRMLRELGGAEDYDALYQGLSGFAFARLPAARGKELDLGKKEYAAACRDRVKKAVANLTKLYGQQSLEEAAERMQNSADVTLKLLELVEEFGRRYEESKREKNIVDFNDLEHEALKLLIKREGSEFAATPVADELARRYVEILVDEYQDSSDVQEALIQSLSAERFGRPNVFMVGDVKQSIYKFRLARPELFMGKYDRFPDYEEGRLSGEEAGPDTGGQERTQDPAAGGQERAAEPDRNGQEERAVEPDRNGQEERAAEPDRNGQEERAAGPDRSGKSTAGEPGGSGTKAGSGGRKIELQQNFRSRASVLNSVNHVFYRIMTRNLGNIQYTDETALHPGAEFPETQEEAGTPTELLMTDVSEAGAGEAGEELEEYTSREMEAKLIAMRIRQLTEEEHGLSVWDKEKQAYRRAEYGDMVILLRTLTGWTDSFLNVLTQEGIPAFAETGTGYFDTVEVETVLAMLAVIDNPIQDIPLAAVFQSPIVGMDEEELAWLMAVKKHTAQAGEDRGMYGAIRLVLWGEEREKEAHAWETLSAEAKVPEQKIRSISLKVQRFFALFEELRRQAKYLPIHELIHRMYLMTGYYDYVSAMPAGEVRRANLDMLIEKARSYGQTSYQGLFHFIRYIKKLKQYDTDFGEAAAAGASTQMVRLMSIHKSKGLEFPIVFLAGLGKPFNKQDIRGKLLIDADLGLGADDLDVENRVRTATLKKQVLKRKMELDVLGEELRVLYVAMTRAKEKLILTGVARGLEKKREKWRQRTWESLQIPYTVLATAGSFLDWILMAGPEESPLFDVKEVLLEQLVGDAVERKLQKAVSEEELRNLDLSVTYDQEMKDSLERTLSYEYPYRADISLHTKLSVSELKKQGQDTDDQNSFYEPLIPEFLRAQEGERAGARSGGAARGSAYHRVLELLDFPMIRQEQDVREWLDHACREGRIAESVRKLVNPQKLWRFVDTPLGRRISRAQKEGRLYREQQFVIGIPAKDMGLGESEELVLIQGIIDVWIEEEDGLILIDYKTDRVCPGQEEALKQRYQVQLDYYRRALEQMRKKKVKETILYSLTLEKEI